MTIFRTLQLITFAICISVTGIAQNKERFDPSKPLIERVDDTPDDILARFQEAGMSPNRHQLTAGEAAMITAAFKALPPLHQEVLKEHLVGISFLDNMPNTALTSYVETEDSVRLYHITFRAAILHQQLSDWLAEKERTCFSQDSSGISISFQTGDLSAIMYVLLHESTHVIDGSLGLFDNVKEGFAAGFNKGVWGGHSTIIAPLTDTLLAQNRFRRGGLYPLSKAPIVYRSLQQSPFVSLYSTSSWSEDLAECLSVYHLTQKFKQPFKLMVSEHGKVVLTYEPAKNKLVKERMKGLGIFYKNKAVQKA